MDVRHKELSSIRKSLARQFVQCSAQIDIALQSQRRNTPSTWRRIIKYANWIETRVTRGGLPSCACLDWIMEWACDLRYRIMSSAVVPLRYALIIDFRVNEPTAIQGDINFNSQRWAEDRGGKGREETNRNYKVGRRDDGILETYQDTITASTHTISNSQNGKRTDRALRFEVRKLCKRRL